MDITVNVFDHGGKHWVYLDDLLQALDGCILDTPIPWDKCEQTVINGRMAVNVEFERISKEEAGT